uniref:Uncharacterized protein n=1 Tax=Rhizophora mucronata TaxID=61149 RepID=A0A2P2PR14_RHIMU
MMIAFFLTLFYFALWHLSFLAHLLSSSCPSCFSSVLLSIK